MSHKVTVTENDNSLVDIATAIVQQSDLPAETKIKAYGSSAVHIRTYGNESLEIDLSLEEYSESDKFIMVRIPDWNWSTSTRGGVAVDVMIAKVVKALKISRR